MIFKEFLAHRPYLRAKLRKLTRWSGCWPELWLLFRVFRVEFYLKRYEMAPKLKEWLKRYLPAEILSVVATVAGAWLAVAFSANAVSTALAATWAGNVAYFGYIILSDVRLANLECTRNGSTFTGQHFLQIIKTLFIEFGVAEVADSFFIRPGLLYYLPVLTGNLTFGVILAKFAADVTFYIPAIIGYEFNKRKLKTVASEA